MHFIQYSQICCMFVLMFKCFLVHGTIPDYIHVCHRSDPDLNNCILQSVNLIRPKLRDGIPELMVPPMEPLTLGNISLQRGPQGARVNLNVTDLLAWGPNTFNTKYVHYNLEKNIFEFKAIVPNIHFKGKYSINMKVILLQLKGQGIISGNFSNFIMEARMYGQKKYNASTDSEHLFFKKISINLRIGHSFMKLDGLFADDPLLNRVANDILGDNSAIFVEEIRPALEKSLGKVFTDIANGITSSFTYDELFPL